jgi:hypothetical protein
MMTSALWLDIECLAATTTAIAVMPENTMSSNADRIGGICYDADDDDDEETSRGFCSEYECMCLLHTQIVNAERRGLLLRTHTTRVFDCDSASIKAQ